MNKRKVAVFVEGLTEQIFVRELLYVWYGYDTNRIGFHCYSLRADDLHDTPYNVGSAESEYFYQIINVGNDESVLSKMLREVERLTNQGFTTIIGLKDMYGDKYKSLSQHREVQKTLNEKFIDGAKGVIRDYGVEDRVHICFAIMEIEAWFLGLETLFTSIDISLTPKTIREETNIDITQDPEVTIFHPFVTLCKILELKGIRYNKHESDISSLISKLTKTDYEILLESGKCASFKTFLRLLIGDN